jgi:broad specificity phosphatase PhoE
VKLYFVRHGESVANVLGVISNRDEPHPLTDKGREQAELLAASLLPCAITALYTSPILRAVQTAEILSQRLGIGFQMMDALREYDCGILEGKSGAEVWEIYWALRQDWMQHRCSDHRIEGGESFLDMQARFVPFVQTLIAEAGQSDGNKVLIGHGGLYRSVLPLVLTNIDLAFPEEHPFPNTGYVVAETRPEGLVCLEWCGVKRQS